MSVVGLDVGNDTSCVAMARKRGIDVLLNKESKRETPAVVNFGEKMRFLGTDGLAKMGLAPQNTVHQLKRLLGRKFQDPKVQADLAKLPFAVSEDPSSGGCLLTVQFAGEKAVFTPEQVMAMVLVDLKKIAEAESGVPPIDCVISVPAYFGEAQRYAMINSAQIAGLNCLRLMNETTATALAYGIFKTDLPETDPVHVAFVDVGHSSTQVSVASFKRSGLTMRSHTWDDTVGGRDFDELLFDHFCAEFKAKHKIDIKSNKKASFKLRNQCEKMKKILSANPEATLAVECIMEDVDVRGAMTREAFEGMMAPMLDRFRGVLEQGLARSGLTAADISSVEVVGSSTRVPALARIVKEVFGREPSRTMNAKECVSRGCALQCAMLSPVFKVREFEVVDSVPVSIEFQWDKEGGGDRISQVLFEAGSPFPAAKMLTFVRAEPFTITATAKETGEEVGEWKVGPFQVPAGGDKAKLKVKVRYNLHGLVSVENVHAIEEEEVAEGDAKMEDAAAGGAPTANGEHPAPMDTDAAAASAAAGDGANNAAGAAAAAPAKKKVRKIDVPFNPLSQFGYSQKQLDDFFEKEGQMAAVDKLQEETADRKNAVEAYLYKLRNGLYGELEVYATPAEKDKILEKLQATEDWLYDEGEDCTKSVYVAKLEELQTLGGPVFSRQQEDQTRPEAVSALRSAAEGYLSFASSSEPRYSHIPPEDRETVAREAGAALSWLNEKVGLQSGLGKAEPPVLTAADCRKKLETLDRVAKPIVTKPPPPKPAPAPKPADAAPAPEGTPAPMESEGGSEGAAGGEGTPGPDQDPSSTPMETA